MFFLTLYIYIRLDPFFNRSDPTHDPTRTKKFDDFFCGFFLSFSSMIGGTGRRPQTVGGLGAPTPAQPFFFVTGYAAVA